MQHGPPAAATILEYYRVRDRHYSLLIGWVGKGDEKTRMVERSLSNLVPFAGQGSFPLAGSIQASGTPSPDSPAWCYLTPVSETRVNGIYLKSKWD